MATLIELEESKIRRWLRSHDYTGPLFLYDLDVITRQTRLIQAAFRHYEKFELLYAAKANNNPAVVEHLVGLGLGVHVSTLSEMELARRITDNISYTGPIITPQAMDYAVKYGVMLNANSLYDAERLVDVDGIGLRINPGLGSSSHPDFYAGDPLSQFGVRINEVGELSGKAAQRISRLHMHTSSDSYRIDLFLRAFERLLVVAADLPAVTTVNVGGSRCHTRKKS